MSNLIYVVNISLDGFIEDQDGKFDWIDPSQDVFTFITDLVRTMRTHLYGRRMYATMMVWETDPNLAAESTLMRNFAEIWQAANKIVYSTTLENISTRKTQLSQTFDPEAIRKLKAYSEYDILIGGSELTAHAFRVGLIDECHLFLLPILVEGQICSACQCTIGARPFGGTSFWQWYSLSQLSYKAEKSQLTQRAADKRDSFPTPSSGSQVFHAYVPRRFFAPKKIPRLPPLTPKGYNTNRYGQCKN